MRLMDLQQQDNPHGGFNKQNVITTASSLTILADPPQQITQKDLI